MPDFHYTYWLTCSKCNAMYKYTSSRKISMLNWSCSKGTRTLSDPTEQKQLSIFTKLGCTRTLEHLLTPIRPVQCAISLIISTLTQNHSRNDGFRRALPSTSSCYSLLRHPMCAHNSSMRFRSTFMFIVLRRPQTHTLATPSPTQLITPFHIYFNYRMILQRRELWRIITNFFYFGNLGASSLHTTHTHTPSLPFFLTHNMF